MSTVLLIVGVISAFSTVAYASGLFLRRPR